MAIDIFLKFDGFKGESVDKNHKEWVDVLAWSWGLSNSGSTHVGGGAGAGKVDVQDLSFTSFLDKSSPFLMTAVATGQPLKNAFLNVRGGSTYPDNLKITMTNVLVTSLSSGGIDGHDRLTQNVTLNFAKVRVEYQQVTNGKLVGSPLVFEWEIDKGT